MRRGSSTRGLRAASVAPAGSISALGLADAKAAGAATLNYGVFLNTVIDFLLISCVIFLLVRQLNRFKKTEPAAAPSTRPCPYCDTAISLKASRCPHCTSEVTAASA
jgi:large conductance mechanosensitive channel